MMAICLAFALLGVVLLRASHAASLGVAFEAESGQRSGNQADGPSAGASQNASVLFGAAGGGNGGGGNSSALLLPYSMGFAPYAYIPYGNVVMADFATGSGAKNFFGAFVLGAGCTPLWDGATDLGLASSRSTAIQTDITNVRSKGGDVAVSFGGQSGTELADSCTDATQLQSAYQNTVTTYGLQHINFDIEGPAETNAAGLGRRVQAVAALQKANPALKVSLTLPVAPSGLDANGLAVLKKFHDGGVVLNSVLIMAMDFGSGLTGAQSARIQSAAQGTVAQMKQLYPGVPDSSLWKALGIIVMVGQNDTPEVFQLTDAQAVKAFAQQNGVGTLSMWSANRDQACPSGNSTTASDVCSGISQTKYQFTQAMLIPAL